MAGVGDLLAKEPLSHSGAQSVFPLNPWISTPGSYYDSYLIIGISQFLTIQVDWGWSALAFLYCSRPNNRTTHIGPARTIIPLPHVAILATHMDTTLYSCL